MSFIHQMKRAVRKLSPLELAAAELVDAELAKLTAETGREWAEAAVAYNAARVKRLKAYIKSVTEGTP